MKDNLIAVRMAIYLSLAYDKPNLPNRQVYAHVAIATSSAMTHVLLSSESSPFQKMPSFFATYTFRNRAKTSASC